MPIQNSCGVHHVGSKTSCKTWHFTLADSVQLVRCVRDLGMYIDSDVSMRIHITRTMSNCFSVLQQFRSIRRFVSQPVLLSLVTSLKLS